MDERANAEALRLIGDMMDRFRADMSEQAQHLHGALDRLREMRGRPVEAGSFAGEGRALSDA